MNNGKEKVKRRQRITATDEDGYSHDGLHAPEHLKDVGELLFVERFLQVYNLSYAPREVQHGVVYSSSIDSSIVAVQPEDTSSSLETTASSTGHDLRIDCTQKNVAIGKSSEAYERPPRPF